MTVRVMVILTLIVFIVMSAVGVVYSKHKNRKLFTEFQRLKVARDNLDAEWGRLQLEQGTWVMHGRVEQIARERLGMRLPTPESTVIIRQ